ncbi:MAG: peptide chain release factor N(5)-glutamine methyltransferase [Peptococcaceae bacterium]|nr:peptide chain release factor N(5)-glutamine methyltransferase [Peptococcaceae bacterium]
MARKRFRTHGIDTAALDAEVCVLHITGMDRAALYQEWDRTLKDQELAQYNIFTNRRLSGEPVAYITGNKGFMSLDFYVDKSVLIPRPETELLVEKALEIMPPCPFLVDVGTGSGAIAVSLAYYNRGARVTAIDRSVAALEVARHNCIRHGVSDRVTLQPGDLLQPLVGSAPKGGVDLIAANLPYIAEGDLPELPGEVRMFEPRLALAGGRDGLAHYRRLIPQAVTCLREGGYLLMEIGFDQGPPARGLFDPQFWEVQIKPDLAGLDRLVVARYKGAGRHFI